jgi:hypothetical protein
MKARRELIVDEKEIQALEKHYKEMLPAKAAQRVLALIAYVRWLEERIKK